MYTEFLARLNWAKVLLQFEAVGPVGLPPFCGPSFRGALGHALRPALCERQPSCQTGCAAPESCRYYALFERNRARAGTGPNIPKPMVLAPPIPSELESIVLGGPVPSPYRIGRPLTGELIPALYNDHSFLASPGAEIALGFTCIGQAAAVLVPVIDFLRHQELRCGTGRLALRRVVDCDGSGRVLFDSRCPSVPIQHPRLQSLAPDALSAAHSVGRLRVVFRTPALLKLGSAVCFDPEQMARVFLEHCMIRAVQVYNAFFVHHDDQLPWMTMPDLGVRLAGHRLFHYVLPRLSLRQDRWMRFDGLVGYMDLVGNLTPALPFLRAAEVLHFGQKATFGLGAVQCFQMES